MTDNFFQKMLDDTQPIFDKMMRESEKTQLQDDFSVFDINSLGKMSKKELITWQSKHPEDSPQYLAANREWEHRSSKKHILWGIVGVLIGAAATLGATLLQNQTNNPEKHQTSINKEHQAHPIAIKSNVAASQQPHSTETKKPHPNQ